MKCAILQKTFLLLCCALFAGSVGVEAQCLSGDCKNGTGKYDFGYAVYTGSFKNGKPEGQGTMDYGGGEKYTGGFRNGKEDGEGIFYNASGSSKWVYREGFKVSTEKVQPVVVGHNKSLEPQPDNCISGDCLNGFGKMSFNSGNAYNGHFRNGKFHGQGEFCFASGNVLKARFDNHMAKDGSFLYKKEQMLFKGSFKDDGTPLTGKYESLVQEGAYVEVANGKITKTHNPERERQKAAMEHAMKYASCSYCKGQGGSKQPSYYTTSKSEVLWGGNSPGWVGYETTTKKVYTGGSYYVPCGYCSGTGEVKR